MLKANEVISLLLNETNVEGHIKEALGFVKRFTLMGSRSVDHGLSKKAVDFLKQTVKKKSYKLYRGMGLIRQRVKKENIDTLNGLQVGDSVPDFLLKALKPYTKKKSVARSYIEGTVSLMIEVKVSSDQVLCDLENLESIAREYGIIDDSDFEYFHEDKEVIILKPTTGVVILKNGNL